MVVFSRTWVSNMDSARRTYNRSLDEGHTMLQATTHRHTQTQASREAPTASQCTLDNPE
jgi:hypothetical protein